VTHVSELATKIVDEIISDLCDRAGLADEWGAIEPEIRADIRKEWIRLAEERISRARAEVS
jgi:hypothetical protein